MATRTLGTTAQTSLTAVAMLHGLGSLLPADVATINNAIKNDSNPAHPIIGGSFAVGESLLFIPRRGVLKVFAGDYVGVDSQGWPILVSANSIANAAWIHT